MTSEEERTLLTENIARLDAAIQNMSDYRTELAAILAAIPDDPENPDDGDDNDGPGSN